MSVQRLLCAIGLLACAPALQGQDVAGILDQAERAMGTAGLSSIQYSGSGSSYFVGQSLVPGGSWLHYTLKAYVADVDYATPAMRQEMDRLQDDGGTPFGGVHQVWFVRGEHAWNVSGSATTARLRDPGGTRTRDLRNLEILLTPPGFLKAARAHGATARRSGASTIVTFTTPNRFRVTGVLNAAGLLEKTESVVDNTVLGDMPVVMMYSGYQRFGDITFPSKIVETIGGYPALELTVADVKANGAARIGEAPAVAREVGPSATVKADTIGPGVWYLTGGNSYSLLVEFNDHLVVLEAPEDDDRSHAVIAEVRRIVPGKPIRYVVNTHSHFDHAGGLRVYAAEGATIVAAMPARAFLEATLRAPRTINPDTLIKSGKQATVEGVDRMRVLTDGTQRLELHTFEHPHATDMLFPYLPREKVLVQADVAVAPPPNAPPGPPNMAARGLHDQIVTRDLDVARIAGIHGRITTWGELRALAGR